MYLNLLLAAAPAAKAVADVTVNNGMSLSTIIMLVLTIPINASLAWGMFTWFIKRREDKAKLEQELRDKEKAAAAEEIKKMKSELADHTIKHMQHATQREHLVEADRQWKEGVKQQLSQIDTFVSKVNSLESKFEAQTNQINDLKQEVRDLKGEMRAQGLETRSDMKSQLDKIFEILKDK